MKGAEDPFRATIGKLWDRLGLPTPRFHEPGRVQLRIDEVALDLLDDGRGNLVVEGLAGYLSDEPADRAKQVDTVLGTNHGLLVDLDVGVYLAEQPNRKRAIAVRATHPLESDDMDRLIKKLEDAVQTIEYYRPELTSAEASTARRGNPGPDGSEPTVIFRP